MQFYQLKSKLINVKAAFDLRFTIHESKEMKLANQNSEKLNFDSPIYWIDYFLPLQPFIITEHCDCSMRLPTATNLPATASATAAKATTAETAESSSST